MKNLYFCFVLALSCATTTACAQDTAPSQNSKAPEYKEILPGVHVKYGTHSAISSESVAHIANHGFIIGERSVAVIDPGGSVAAAQATLAVIAQLTDLPVSHVIITHMHPDHSIGLAAYSADLTVRPTIHGHPALANSLLHNLDFFTDNFVDTVSAQQLGDMIDAGSIKPVESEQTIDLGNRELLLTPFKLAHTATDLTVFDLASNTLWAGDLLFVERLPALDGSLRGWISAMTTIDNMDPEMVIPGHGNSGVWEEVAKPQRNYLKTLLKNTRSAIAKGHSLKRFIDSNVLTNHGSIWTLFDTQHGINLTRAYTELEWE